MKYGKTIINLCNITSNKVQVDVTGYCVDFANSDSRIQFTTIRSNNQSSNWAVNFHRSDSNKLISAISCNYIENKDFAGKARLIMNFGTADSYLFGCCLIGNEVKYAFENQGNSFIVNNTFTDNYQTLSKEVIFTDKILNTDCNIIYIPDLPNYENKEMNADDDSWDIEKVKRKVRYLDEKPKIIYFIIS